MSDKRQCTCCTVSVAQPSITHSHSQVDLMPNSTAHILSEPRGFSSLLQMFAPFYTGYKEVTCCLLV